MKLLHKMLGLTPDNIELPQNNVSPEVVEDSEPPKNVLGNITFSILTNGNVHIGCQWIDNQVADKQIFYQSFGELLYQINSGSFAEEIISILITHMENTPQDTEMINHIIGQWQAIKDHVEDQPLIQPSSVFSNPQINPDMHEMEE